MLKKHIKTFHEESAKKEGQYNLEEGEDGMMYDGELPHPEDNSPLEVGKSKCKICFKMVGKKNMYNHLRIHTGAKPFACPYCDHRSNQASNMKIHQKRCQAKVVKHSR